MSHTLLAACCCRGMSLISEQQAIRSLGCPIQSPAKRTPPYSSISLARTSKLVPENDRNSCDPEPSSLPYLAAVTDFTEMVSPLAVPVTLACSQASLLSSSSAVLFEVSRV